jgi:hypothetical protein
MIAQASPAAGPLQTDPTKRVNYTLGLVLGVDEFQQDQLYHAAGRRGHNRLLHGYGTVSGLAVGPITQGADPEIQVDAGVAVDPAGREIRVPDRMCVKVNRWLDRHQAALRHLYGNTPVRPIPVAVVLCHRECPTDTVPVPGEPCRSQDDAMQPSRIRESFELKLMLRDDAPWNRPLDVNPHGLGVYRLHHPEEQAVRAFGELLARVQSTTDELLGEHGRGELLREVRALATAADERELASPPPATDDPILLPAAVAPDILREAFRIWVTEVRPAIRTQEDPGACNEDQCCVLLAEYDLPVTPLWAVQAGTTPQTAVRPLEERRPYLLHSRLLQEWLIATGGEEGRPDVDSWATLQILSPRRIRMWVHHDAWLDVPREAITVVLNDVPLPANRISTLVWADVRNVWDVMLTDQMRDGDVVEIRFNTELIELVEAPPEPQPVQVKAEVVETHVPRHRVKDAIARVVDAAAERLGRAGDDTETSGDRESGGETGEETGDDVEVAAARGPGEETDAEMGVDDDPNGDNSYGDWTPAGAARLEPVQTVADELRGPTGEYLDRYGWTLSAFTVYNRLQGGDLEGEYKLPIVARIQRTPVSKTPPSNKEHYLRFNGSQWVPAFLDEGDDDLRGRYPKSTVAKLQGKTLTAPDPKRHQVLTFNGTAWVPAPVAFDPAESDLERDAPNTRIARLQAKTVTAPDPKQHEVLTFNGTAWVPAAVAFSAEGSDLEGAAPNTRIARLQGTAVTAADPARHQVLTFNGTAWVPAAVAFDPAESDLEGDAPNTRIARLQAHPVDAGAPGANQVLSFDGTTWVAAAVGFSEDSDLTGAAPDTTIAKLQGNPVAAESPNRGELLAFDGTSWVPGTVAFSEDSDLAGNTPDTKIAKLQGHPLAAQGPEPGQFLSYDGTAWVPATVDFSEGSDLTGSAPTTSIARLQGNTLDAQNPDNGQVLSYDGTAWVPAAVGFDPQTSDLTGDAPNTTIARLQGQTVDAATPAANQVLTYNGTAWVAANPASGGGLPSGTAGGDLAGTYPAPSIGKLQGRTVDAGNPAANQVLTFNGTAWVAANPPAGGGSPTGNAGGDLSGTYPAPTVARLQNKPLNAAQPAQGQFLMYNGTAWVAATPPAGGGAPTGNAGGDLSGTYPTPTVAGLQNKPLNAAQPQQGQFLMFNGSAWVPAAVPAPAAPAYQTVAAGVFRVEFTGGTPFSTPLANAFGDLVLSWMDGNLWGLDFPAFKPDRFVYVVKGLANEGVVNVLEFAFDRLVVALPFSFERFTSGTVHLEVSAYPRLVFRPQEDESAAGTRKTSFVSTGTGGTQEAATGAPEEAATFAAPAETTKTTTTRTTRKR